MKYASVQTLIDKKSHLIRDQNWTFLVKQQRQFLPFSIKQFIDFWRKQVFGLKLIGLKLGARFNYNSVTAH